MAAISNISNGEALSSVRTKLNSVITEINLLDPTDWIDYSATSTIVGWSSFTAGYKTIRYKVIGKIVFVEYAIDGTSNSTSTSFTLPFNAVNISRIIGFSYCVNNGIIVGGYYFMTQNSNIVNGSTGLSAGSWNAAGTKTFTGQLFYEIA